MGRIWACSKKVGVTHFRPIWVIELSIVIDATMQYSRKSLSIQFNSLDTRNSNSWEPRYRPIQSGSMAGCLFTLSPKRLARGKSPWSRTSYSRFGIQTYSIRCWTMNQATGGLTPAGSFRPASGLGSVSPDCELNSPTFKYYRDIVVAVRVSPRVSVYRSAYRAPYGSRPSDHRRFRRECRS